MIAKQISEIQSNLQKQVQHFMELKTQILETHSLLQTKQQLLSQEEVSLMEIVQQISSSFSSNPSSSPLFSPRTLSIQNLATIEEKVITRVEEASGVATKKRTNLKKSTSFGNLRKMNSTSKEFQMKESLLVEKKEERKFVEEKETPSPNKPQKKGRHKRGNHSISIFSSSNKKENDK